MKEKSNHLIHSINKVTDLLKSNHELREQVDRKNHEKEEIEGKLFLLNSKMKACLNEFLIWRPVSKAAFLRSRSRIASKTQSTAVWD